MDEGLTSDRGHSYEGPNKIRGLPPGDVWVRDRPTILAKLRLGAIKIAAGLNRPNSA